MRNKQFWIDLKNGLILALMMGIAARYVFVQGYEQTIQALESVSSQRDVEAP